jgi:GH43 family beta-xylosidase
MVKYIFLILYGVLCSFNLDGQYHTIMVESEDFFKQDSTQLRKWEIIDNGKGTPTASNKKYIQCLPDSRVTHDDKLISGVNFTDTPGKLAIVSYKVSIPYAGRYYVWASAFSTGSEDNGVHVGINGTWPDTGKRIQWCAGKNKWTWSGAQRTQKNHCGEKHLIYLDIPTSGEHIVQFSMREDGVALDRFLLTTDISYDPNIHIKRKDIYIRDPFIYANALDTTYYMFSSARDKDSLRGVIVYKSKDLENWTHPAYVFKLEAGWWPDHNHGVWAPEVHHYNGKYYLFATFTNKNITLKAKDKNAKTALRGTSILVSDALGGPYVPIQNSPHTPKDWMALDGTLFIENNDPYLVFCREWIQVNNGTFEFQKLSPNLDKTMGKPKTMFKAGDAQWAKSFVDKKNWNTYGTVSDGAWFYRSKNNDLLMLWSSFGEAGYAVGLAKSSNGRLNGKWKQLPTLYTNDGGHPMIFKTFEGKMILSIHQPNKGDIRAKFIEIEEKDNLLILGKEL